MAPRLLALTLVLCGTLGPAVCRAACAERSAPVAMPCHEPPADERAPVHDETCCDDVDLARFAAPETPPAALATAFVPVPEPTPADKPLLAGTLPRPPDVDNSPYVRVTPPRRAYPS